ncbi:MAG TPA: Ig domain-containing protein [Bryocella sp.]|nr:Ig domain-containing protein [Bryocella sp.]
MNSAAQLTIGAASLPSGTVGTAYSYSVPASGGTPPYVWSVQSGTLPVGLKLSSKGVISGTPEAGGTTSFTLAVIDSEAVPASTTGNFSIAIGSELAVTSISPPSGSIGSSYSTSLSAAGGTPPYTWTLLNGNLPSGLNLSSAGLISGTPASGGNFLFTVQVTDSESPAQTAIAQLTIAISTITITTHSLPAGSVNVPYSASLTAAGGVAPYTWTLSGTLPAGLSLSSAGIISGTPTGTGTANFSVQVADSEQPPATATAQLGLIINNQTNAGGLQGNYAFYLNGFNSGGAWTLAGSFLADGSGNITNGAVDFNSASGQPVNTTITGTYRTSGTAVNTMTVQGASWGPMTLAFVLDSSGNGRVIEYDDPTGQGSRGSGALRKANASAFSLGELTGSWAFGLTGAGPGSERFVQAGQFTVASGSISNGSCDSNDGGSYQTCTFTGTLSAVNPQTGRALATIERNSGTANLAVYVVTSSELLMEQVDAAGDGNPLLVGSVLEQSGPLSDASLNGPAILYMQDISEPGGPSQSIAGLLSFDGMGDVNILAMNEDLAGIITIDQPSQGTYSVAGNGAVTMNCQNCPAGFLAGQNQGFFVGTGISSVFGIMEPQTGGPFSNASLAGSYAAGSLPPLDYQDGENEVAEGLADGLGTLTLTADSSDSGGLSQAGMIVHYDVSANGTGAAQFPNEPVPAVVYMISPDRWIALLPDTDASVEVFQH